MISEWYACAPCQICNEESKFVCHCSKVYLCENCLSKHLMLEVSAKHKPVLLDNMSQSEDGNETRRKDVLNSIKSKLQNEVLQIEEFKRISQQTITDYVFSLEKELKSICEKLIKEVDDKCNLADSDLRAAISLSKLSLNVNHPILDLFRRCKTTEDVKNIEIVSKKLNFEKINIHELIEKNTFFSLEINKDFKSRVLPVKSPAESVFRPINKSRSNTEEEFFTNEINIKSSTKTFILNEDSDDRIRSISRIWTMADTYSSTSSKTKSYIEMELQERVSSAKSEPRMSIIYSAFEQKLFRFRPFTQEVLALNLRSLQTSSIVTDSEKFFPKAAWTITDDEKIIFSGGFDGRPRNSTILYSLHSNKIEKSGNMIYFRYHHSLVSCGKFVYAIGGMGSKALKECEKFNLEKKIWSKVGNMAIGRENPGVCYSYNKIYICGGTGIESFEVFNPTTNKFSLLVLRLPSPGKCCLFPYDDIIYILQKNKIYKVEIPKIAFSIVNDVENKEWWSPCESQATTNGIFFCFEENFYKLSVDDHSITLINFIPN